MPKISWVITVIKIYEIHSKVKRVIFSPTIWALSQENLILLHVNNKDTDQPVHPHSLISASEKYIAKLDTHNISIFWLFSVGILTFTSRLSFMLS